MKGKGMPPSSAWCYSCGCCSRRGIYPAARSAVFVAGKGDPALPEGARHTMSVGAAHQRGAFDGGHPRCGWQPVGCTWVAETESDMEGQHIEEPFVVAGASAAAVAGRLRAGPSGSTCLPSSGASHARARRLSR